MKFLKLYIFEGREAATKKGAIDFLYAVKQKTPDLVQKMRNTIVNKGLYAAKQLYMNKYDPDYNYDDDRYLPKRLEKSFDYLTKEEKKKIYFYIKKIKDSTFKKDIIRYFTSFWNSKEFRAGGYSKRSYADIILDGMWNTDRKKPKPVLLESYAFAVHDKRIASHLSEPPEDIVPIQSIRFAKYLIDDTLIRYGIVMRVYNIDTTQYTEDEKEILHEIIEELKEYDSMNALDVFIDTAPKKTYTYNELKKAIVIFFNKISLPYILQKIDKKIKEDPTTISKFPKYMTQELKNKWKEFDIVMRDEDD